MLLLLSSLWVSKFNLLSSNFIEYDYQFYLNLLIFYMIMWRLYHKLNKKQWLFFMIPLFCLSCEKDERDGTTCEKNCFVFSGIVVDTPANNALAHAEVAFSFIYYNSFLRPSIPLGTIRTDAKGKYSFRFDGTKYLAREGYFASSVKKDGYFLDGYYPDSFHRVGMYQLNELQFDKPSNERISLFKRAEMEIHIKNIKKLELTMLEVSYGPETRNIGFVISPVAPDLDTIVKVTIPADIKSSVKWKGLNSTNPLQFERSETVSAKSGEVTRYQIDF